MIKRCFDIVLASIGLILFTPLFLYIALRIYKEDKGSIFYRGERVGLRGKPFRIYKFRTMVVNAEKVGPSSTSDDDPRITKIGRFLRKYKLDELPQLINVLKGEMSFVGPRPEVPSEVATYNEEERKILSVRPGITDWASLTYHNEGEILKGAEDPHQAYREKIRPGKIKLAIKYVDKQSFFIDLRIIMDTLRTLIKTRS